MPTLGVVIATPGRRSIMRTINSITAQGLLPGDDVIIVGDGYHKPTDELVKMVGPPFRYVATHRTRDWGHSQTNYGLSEVKGDWVIIQDDDDIFLPRAFDEIRRITGKLNEPRIIMGRVKTPFLGILWTHPGVPPFDGHCIVVPNNKEKLGYYSLEYEGDQTWIRTSIESYDAISWADRVWTLTRPTWKLWPKETEGCIKDGYVYRRWYFHREQEKLWEPSPVAWLQVQEEGSHVRAFYGVIPPLKQLDENEFLELAEYAAWAGQGNDVWFTIEDHDLHMERALEAVGYKLHEVARGTKEYCHDWPPKSREAT